jgi:L-rhamnose mutarotase
MRVCFLLKVRLEKVEEYRARHKQVWPEMQEALRDTGWRNYSLFLQADGLLIGYLETDNFDHCRDAMKERPVNKLWQEQMVPLFESLDGAGPDDAMQTIEEIFHLD